MESEAQKQKKKPCPMEKMLGKFLPFDVQPGYAASGGTPPMSFVYLNEEAKQLLEAEETKEPCFANTEPISLCELPAFIIAAGRVVSCASCYPVGEIPQRLTGVAKVKEGQFLAFEKFAAADADACDLIANGAVRAESDAVGVKLPRCCYSLLEGNRDFPAYASLLISFLMHWQPLGVLSQGILFPQHLKFIIMLNLLTKLVDCKIESHDCEEQLTKLALLEKGAANSFVV